MLPYFARYRGTIATGVVCLLICDAFQLLLPAIIGLAVDALLAIKDSGEEATFTILGREMTATRWVVWLAVGLVTAEVIRGTFSFAQRMLLIRTSRRIERDLRDDFFGHMLEMSYQWFNRTKTGDLVSRAANDLNRVRMAIGPGLMNAFDFLFFAGGTLVLLFLYDWRLTLVSLIPIVTVPMICRHYAHRLHRESEAIQERLSELSTLAQENFSGVRVVQAFAREDAEVRRFDGQSRIYVDENVRLARTRGTFRPLLFFIGGIGMMVVLYVGGLQVMEGAMTAGQLTAFLLYLLRLFWPLVVLGWIISLWQQGAASLGRMAEIWDQPPDITSPPDARVPDQPAGSVEFRNLTFGYGEGAEPVLHGVSFQVPAGSTVAVIGRTGAGKSTLVNLVPRFFDPPPGTVFVDGVDVRDWDLRALRDMVGYAPQETFLFSETIAENIAYGAPDADRPAIERASEISRLSEDVKQFADGLDARLGERGVTLSGGQKQRTAIARAILREPHILVLDDSFSAVDTGTEEEILGNLRDVMAGRTVFLISHRISTVKDADQIVVLEDGRVVEQGTHEELLEHDGAYAELHRMQLLEREIEAA